MEGLDAIKNRILSDAKSRASKINADSLQIVSEINKNAVDQSTALLLESQKQALKESQNIKRRFDSLAVLEQRKILLSAKQDLIDQVIKKAMLNLKEMDRKEKEALYRKILEKILTGGEMIQFNEQDQEMGSDLIKLFSFPIAINPVTGNFIGGFIISRDMVEINITFEMIVRQYRSELVAIAANSLFGKE